MIEREARNRYFKEFGSAMVLYMAILFTAIYVARPMENTVVRTMLLLSPMIPVGLVVWAITRAFRRMDEFVRLQSLECVAISAAVTAGWTLTYGFLETAGFPRLSMFTVWPVMGLVWGVLAGVRSFAGR